LIFTDAGRRQYAVSVRVTVGCLSHRSTAAAAAAAAGGFDAERLAIDSCGRRRRVPAAGALSGNGATARRSAANSGSVVLTADEGGRTQTCYRCDGHT